MAASPVSWILEGCWGPTCPLGIAEEKHNLLQLYGIAGDGRKIGNKVETQFNRFPLELRTHQNENVFENSFALSSLS